jgi:hypothetical protein
MEVNRKLQFIKLRLDLIRNVVEFSNNMDIVKLQELRSRRISKVIINRYMQIIDKGLNNFISNPKELKLKKVLFQVSY